MGGGSGTGTRTGGIITRTVGLVAFRCETSVIRHGTACIIPESRGLGRSAPSGLVCAFSPLVAWGAGAGISRGRHMPVFGMAGLSCRASAMPGTARAAFLVRLRPLHGRLPVPHIRQPRPLRRLPAWPAGPLPSRMLKSAAVMPAGRLACPAGHTGAYRAPVPCTPWSSHRAGGGSPAWHARRHGPTSVGAMIFPWPPGVVLPSFFVLSPYP